ncbi:hypothetical protein BVX97_02585 [bacterium E08(2017)]|nr:hypothetical protein BVX97_02585 [bacterium E08(2017)]
MNIILELIKVIFGVLGFLLAVMLLFLEWMTPSKPGETPASYYLLVVCLVMIINGTIMAGVKARENRKLKDESLSDDEKAAFTRKRKKIGRLLPLLYLVAIIAVSVAKDVTAQNVAQRRRDAEKARLEAAQNIKYEMLLVSSHDLAAGTVISWEDLGTKRAPVGSAKGKLVPPDDRKKIKGCKIKVAYPAGTPIRWSDLEPPEADHQ